MHGTRFYEFVNFLKEKKVLIVTHKLADIDGFASCVVLRRFLKDILNSKEIYLIIPEISKTTKRFLEKLEKKYPEFKLESDEALNHSDIDIFLILDTNNLEQVSLKEKVVKSKFIFIDHHFFQQKDIPGNIQDLNLIHDNYTSTAEIIFEMCNSCNYSLEPSYKYLLIAAILTDTGIFKYATNNTIKNVFKLLNDGIDFQEILADLKFEKELDERIANIKGIQRIKLIREKDWLIGLTHVGGYEAEVAKLLIKVGFDIGIVLSEKKTETRITTRAKKKICSITGLHLGKLLEQISRENNCSGGGHEGAASLNYDKSMENILDKIVNGIINILKNI